MSNNNATKFPEGIRVYAPRAGAPDFVKGAMVIDTAKAIAWLQQQGPEVRLDIKEGQKGYYAQINTYQCPEGQGSAANYAQRTPPPSNHEDDLPF